MARIFIYDTTLRDGEQAEAVSFSLGDKLRVAQRLDDFGVDYIEGGWPGSNPKAVDFFKEARRLGLRHAKMAAFGSTRHIKNPADSDPNLQKLLEVEVPVTTIFGKTWDFHVREALRVSLDDNLEMIRSSIAFLRSKGKEVVYDAEHFFDGHRANPGYALATIRAAAEAGASTVVLCDTNGGSLFSRVREITEAVVKSLGVPVGIHTHDDGGLGVANSLAAVEAGATHIQGTINGYGERTGNADLTAIIPNLILKMGHECIPAGNLPRLSEVAHFVAEQANLSVDIRHPFVGACAFAHKGGIHVSAVQRAPETYEHIRPEQVGNVRRVLVSELSGRSNVFWKAEEMGIDLNQQPEKAQAVLTKVKELENQGYEFEGAEGSFELLLKRELGEHRDFFTLDGYRVIVEKRGAGAEVLSEATVRVTINGQRLYMAAEGDGPINALDRALRKALEQAYPQIKGVHLTDYKVRVVNPAEATAAKVRVLIESSDGTAEWGTVGVHENVIEASWRALTDSVDFKLLRLESSGQTVTP
ncbi:MAG: citramalate synthase [Candidatus Sumerlaeia bacterium]|nr:citramalate synthase [Candidatus Sumerlaeia bacterium]